MTGEARTPTALRLGLAVIAAALAATALYGLLRVGQKLLFPEADPATVIWSEHAGYFWRALTAGYVGGMVGVAAWVVAGRDPGPTVRMLAKALPFVVAVIVAQGLLVP